MLHFTVKLEKRKSTESSSGFPWQQQYGVALPVLLHGCHLFTQTMAPGLHVNYSACMEPCLNIKTKSCCTVCSLMHASNDAENPLQTFTRASCGSLQT